MEMVVFKVLLARRQNYLYKGIRSWVDLYLLLQVESGKLADVKWKRSDSRKKCKKSCFINSKLLIYFCVCPHVPWSTFRG